jgi:hypothetical protein
MRNPGPRLHSRRYLIVLNKGVSYTDTSGLEESENHAAAKHKLVDLRGGEGRRGMGE